MPAPHITHSLESVAAVTLVEEPPGQKRHALDVVWPGLGLNFASGQARHAALPVLGLYVPCTMARRCVGENGKGRRGQGTLLRGERKGDHALGMRTHRRARQASC